MIQFKTLKINEINDLEKVFKDCFQDDHYYKEVNSQFSSFKKLY